MRRNSSYSGYTSSEESALPIPQRKPIFRPPQATLRYHNGLYAPTGNILGQGSYGEVELYTLVRKVADSNENVIDHKARKGHMGTEAEISPMCTKGIESVGVNDPPANIAVKHFTREDDVHESGMIKEIQDDAMSTTIGQCRLIGLDAKVIEFDNGAKSIAMPLMDGDLLDLCIEQMSDPGVSLSDSVERVMEMLIQVVQLARCIDQAGYTYADLALENLLYRFKEDGSLHIVVGDMGGLCRKERALRSHSGRRWNRSINDRVHSRPWPGNLRPNPFATPIPHYGAWLWSQRK